LTNRHRSFTFQVKPWLRKGNGDMAAAQNGRLFLGDSGPVTAGVQGELVIVTDNDAGRYGVRRVDLRGK
jgi:hypothetical protein